MNNEILEEWRYQERRRHLSLRVWGVALFFTACFWLAVFRLTYAFALGG